MAQGTTREEAALGRRKVRNACTPCKTRKRKCDGKFPCSTCLRWEYDCVYQQTSKTAPPKQQTSASPPEPTNGIIKPPASGLENAHIQLSPTQANSGVALSQAIANQNAVIKQNVNLGWNVGLRRPPPDFAIDPTLYPCPVGTIIARQDLLGCLDGFFSTVGLLYPVIGRETLESLIQQRFEAANPYQISFVVDALLSLFAAISIIYVSEDDGTQVTVLQLSENAKRCLDTCADDEPTDLHVVSLVLRTLLLRTTGSPHACWMSSCSLVHCLEARQCHSVQSMPSDSPTLPKHEWEALYWTSKLLHMWISFELGRCLATAPLDQTHYPSEAMSNYPSSVLQLFVSSSSLSPYQPCEADQFEDRFGQLEAFDCAANKPLGLSRCINAMTIFRRRYIQSPPVTASFRARVIDLGRHGLTIVQDLLQKPGPWWHLTNLPLQYLCLLLVLDNLSEIPLALDTLRKVAARYPTERVQGTLNFAETVVRAVQLRKQTESRLLDQALTTSIPNITERRSEAATDETATMSDLSKNFPAQWPSLDELDWDMFPNSGAMAFDGLKFT